MSPLFYAVHWALSSLRCGVLYRHQIPILTYMLLRMAYLKCGFLVGSLALLVRLNKNCESLMHYGYFSYCVLYQTRVKQVHAVLLVV